MDDLFEIGAVLGEFFGRDGNGPSHDQLTHVFVATGLVKGDPKQNVGIGVTPSKMKRVREVFDHASEHDPAAGLRLAEQTPSKSRRPARGRLSTPFPDTEPAWPRRRGGDR